MNRLFLSQATLALSMVALTACTKGVSSSSQNLNPGRSAPLNSALVASPATLTFQGPLTISKGGTYSGNYRSTDINTPAIVVNTSEPVVLENCNVTGSGDLIRAWSNADLIVRNCNAYGVRPATGEQGKFISTASAKRVWVLNNYFENVSEGVLVYQFRGDGSANQSIRIIGNIGRNIVTWGRPRGEGAFVGLNQTQNAANTEIAWNQFINEPNKNYSGDNINFYNSSGTASSPINLHDNFVQGAYPSPVTGSDFSGTGMTTDGNGDGVFERYTGFLDAHDNTFISTCNAAMNNAGGHDIHFHHNRMVSSGYLPDGTKLNSTWAATSIFDGYGVPSSWRFNNVTDYNVIGFVAANGVRQDLSPGNCSGCVNNTALPNPITVDTEKNEWNLWNQKLVSNGKKIGSSDHWIDGRSASGNGLNPFWGIAGGVNPPTSTPTATPVATATPVPTVVPPSDPVVVNGLYRAINVNGSALTIDGKMFEAGASAPFFTLSGASNLSLQNIALNPATDANRASMIRSFAWGNYLHAVLTSVPNGLYQVYVYAWEDNASTRYSLSLNSVSVLANYDSGSAGSWVKHGPFNVNVTSGTIDLASAGGDFNLSGIEVYRASSAPSTPTPTPVPATPTPVPPTSGGSVANKMLQAAHSGKCLDVNGASVANGAIAQQYQCFGGSNQRFSLQDKGGGFYQIVAQHSGKCLDINNAATSNGARVQQWDCWGGDNQLFSVSRQGDGSVVLKAKHSGKCLDVSNAFTGNGVVVQQWDCNTQANQRWFIGN